MTWRTRRSRAGDTIVEVLIAMAVASFVLGGAYTIVNHTLANARQAQEHAEALKIAQGQIERLRSIYSAYKLTFSSGTTCIPRGSNSPVSTSDVRCRTAFDDNDLYAVTISKIDPDVTHTNYLEAKVSIDWDGATGKHDNVSLVYRVQPQ